MTIDAVLINIGLLCILKILFKSVWCPWDPALIVKIVCFDFFGVGEDVPPMQLKEGVFRCIMQLYDCLLTEVHERCKKGLGLAKYLNSSLAFFCYDLLSTIEPRQVFELVCLLLNWSFWSDTLFSMHNFILYVVLHMHYCCHSSSIQLG